MYDLVRKFYAYVCQTKGLDQACINIVSKQWTHVEQEIMDALAFDGALIKEGNECACDGRIYSKDSIECWIDDHCVSIVELMNVDFHHGGNARIEKV